MVRADIPGGVGIALRERPHPFIAAQFAPEELAHFTFLLGAKVLRHVVENRQKVVTVLHLVECAPRLTTTPISLSICIEQAIDPFRESFCLATQLSGTN